MARHHPKQITTGSLCEYGCNNIAKFKFKSGKLCCSDAVQKCEGHINRVLETKKKDVDKDGLNALQRGQHAAHKIKLQTGAYARAGKNISKRKNELTESGLRRCEISNNKMRETKLRVGPDGLTNAQRSARKMADNRLNDIDETGLNQYERWTLHRIENGLFDLAFEKSKKIKHDSDTGIKYQGSYELQFINDLKSKFGVEWVKQNLKRGPSIQYIDYYGKQRWYMSDFIIDNTVYEIKSNWTWNRRGKDKILEQNNINKLVAAANAGFIVKLIRERIEIDYATIAG